MSPPNPLKAHEGLEERDRDRKEKGREAWSKVRLSQSDSGLDGEDHLTQEEQEERQRQKARNKGRAQFAKLKATETGHAQVAKRFSQMEESLYKDKP